MSSFKRASRTVGLILLLSVPVFGNAGAEAVPKFDKARFQAQYGFEYGREPIAERMMKKYNVPWETTEQLLEASRDSRPLIRRIALRMLAAKEGEGAKARLIEIMNTDTEMDVRLLAAVILASLGDVSGYPLVLQEYQRVIKAYESPRPISDGNNITMETAGPLDRERMSYLRSALGLGRTLATFGDNRAFELAAKMALESKDPGIRYGAFCVLEEVAQNDRAKLLAEGRDPDPVFLQIAARETYEKILQDLIIDAACNLIGGQAHEKILDAVIDSNNASEEVKAEARSWKQIRAARIEWRKREQQRREQLQRRPEP